MAGAAGRAAAKQAPQEMLGQERDVLAALAQRRQRDRDDVQAVVQVLAELPFGHELLQVPLRGGDDAHVHRERSRAADALDRPLLQHAQQLHLHRQRDVADLVEEDGAAFGHLEAARAVLDGAGERARSCPNSSDSISVSAKMAQLTGDERPAAGGWPGG